MSDFWSEVTTGCAHSSILKVTVKKYKVYLKLGMPFLELSSSTLEVVTVIPLHTALPLIMYHNFLWYSL